MSLIQSNNTTSVRTTLQEQQHADIKQDTSIVRPDKRTTQVDNRQTSFGECPQVIGDRFGLRLRGRHHSTRLEERLQNLQAHPQCQILITQKGLIVQMLFEGIVI